MQKTIFSDEFISKKQPLFQEHAPIRDYSVYIAPHKEKDAVEKGNQCAKEVSDNFIADFEKSQAYCDKNGGNIDLMCHVSTFYKIDGRIYMTYYANQANTAENPDFQVARLAYCPKNDTSDMTILDILKVGDTVCGKKVDRVYDTIMMYDGGKDIYILFTASLDGVYYRLYCIFDTATDKCGNIKVNRLKVGNIVNDFSASGIYNMFCEKGIKLKETFSDIGIMQKLSWRMENGVKYYYSGAYSGYLTFVIKSSDFITWEYVSLPDFTNFSLYENATYVLDDKVYYFVRQTDCQQGFLTYYDLKSNSWQKPVLIADCQSRADFFMYKDNLYLVNAPKNREGFAVIKIDRNDITKSSTVFSCDLKSSLFYPFVQVYGDYAFISYTVDRKHIRLSKFKLTNYIKD